MRRHAKRSQALTGSKAFTTVGDAQEAGRGAQLAGEVGAAPTLKLGPRGERVAQGEIEEAVRARLMEVPGARFSVGGGGLGEKLSLISTPATTRKR